MFQFMSSSPRPIMKLYNYIFYLFFSFQFNIMILFIISLLPRSLYSPWCRSPCCIDAFFCACIWNKAECYWMMAPFFSRCRSQWLQFDTFEAQKNEPLDSRRFVFCSCWQGFVLLDKSQREEEEEKKLHDETIVKKLLFIIKRFDFHENFITLHFSILKNALADFMVDSSFERVHFYDHCMYQSEYNRRRARFLGLGLRLSHVSSFSHIQGFVLWEILIDDIFRGFRSNLKNP